MTYSEWYSKVNAIVGSKAGVGVDDLPDFPSRDQYEDGVSPEDAASDALYDAGFTDHEDEY